MRMKVKAAPCVGALGTAKSNNSCINVVKASHILYHICGAFATGKDKKL